jgi:exodeoxyribonuclease-3
VPLTLLTLNIGAPSLERARRQLRWLAARDERVFVLTETKAAPGSQFLAESFTAAGYTVVFPEHAPGELGVMIISKLAAEPDPLNEALDYLPARAAGITVDTTHGPLRVLGAYVPSRDATLEKTERKKTWITRFHHALDHTAGDTPAVLLGDLNVLEPDHQPRHRGQFAPFEYDLYTNLTARHDLVDLYRHLHPDQVDHSWARRPELGYRYDHAHGSPALTQHLTTCDYLHETRHPSGDEGPLTDHSGLAVRLDLAPTTPLLTSDPATAAGHAEPEPEPTLF